MDDPNRGTGRTTGLILMALGNAALARGKSVEFIDHCPHTRERACTWKEEIAAKAELLNLSMEVTRKGSRVFVRSLVRREEAQLV